MSSFFEYYQAANELAATLPNPTPDNFSINLHKRIPLAVLALHQFDRLKKNDVEIKLSQEELVQERVKILADFNLLHSPLLDITLYEYFETHEHLAQHHHVIEYFGKLWRKFRQ